MRYLSVTIIIIATALWLGGLAAIFAFAPAIFNAFGEDRQTAGRATSAVFKVFAGYQLVLAAAALIGAFLGYLQERTILLVVIFVLFAIGAVGAVFNHILIVPRLEEMRLGGDVHSETFRKLHGFSMVLALGITSLVFVAAVLIPAVCRTLLATPNASADS